MLSGMRRVVRYGAPHATVDFAPVLSRNVSWLP